MDNHVSSYDTAGFLYFKPNSITYDDLHSQFSSLIGDNVHTLQLKKEWVDDQLGLHHFRYLLHFQDVPVEGAEVISHADQDGYMIFANGSLTKFDVDRSYEPVIPESEALDIILESLEGQSFAWNNDDWEAEIKEELENPNVTYFPSGELIYALESMDFSGWTIDPNEYRLAWRFKVITLEPYLHRDFFVDVESGHVFRTDTLSHTKGTANILFQGNQVIDTRYKGFLTNKYILQTNNNGRHIRTKYGTLNAVPFSFKSDVKDKNDIWGSTDQRATTVHWCASESWDFFSSVYNHNGPDGNGSDLRVYADSKIKNARYAFPLVWGKDHIEFGSINQNYTGTIDIVGHEFTHGVQRYTSNLKYKDESGALNESFSDIFGFMIERFAEGAISDWEIGEGVFISPRSLEDPKTGGQHFNANNTLTNGAQPDTYLGQFWYNGNKDRGGVHVNSSVQNYWFYLLAQGGSGINDNFQGYNVQDIGVDNAARIAFNNMANVLHSTSNYHDARAGAITSANLIFGHCSFETIQTENAWYAVGVGNQSSCPNIGLSQLDSSKPTLYPNPTEGNIHISLNQACDGFIEIYNSSGSTLERISFKNDKLLKYNLRDRPSGIYLIRVITEDETYNYRVTKN